MLIKIFGTLGGRSLQFCENQPHLRLIVRTLKLASKRERSTHIKESIAPNILFSCEQVMIDERVQITTDGLQPGQKVTLFASMTEASNQYGSCGHYVASDQGVVDTFKDASSGGTFSGIEPMGLFWSMKSKPGGQDRRLFKADVMSPYDVSIKVLNGFYNIDEMTWETKEGTCLASGQLFRSYTKSGVKRVVVEEDGVYGTLFLPPGDGPFPAVIDIFGFTNECLEFRSALLASYGFASFVINYIRYKDLPQTEQSLDFNYFLRAFDFLASHPNVDKKELGGIATCAGAAYLLLIASKRPTMKCLVTVNGVLFPFGPAQEVEGDIIATPKPDLKDSMFIDDKMVMRTIFKPGFELFARPAWHHGAKILFIHGLGDECSSPECLERLIPLIPKSYMDQVTVLTYPGAGHLLEAPYSPHVLSNYNPLFKRNLLWGGEPVLHAQAQEQSWQRILDFLHTHLKTV